MKRHPLQRSEGVLRGATQSHTLRGTQGHTGPSQAPRWFINQDTRECRETPAEECAGPYQNEGEKVKNYIMREKISSSLSLETTLKFLSCNTVGAPSHFKEKQAHV